MKSKLLGFLILHLIFLLFEMITSGLLLYFYSNPISRLIYSVTFYSFWRLLFFGIPTVIMLWLILGNIPFKGVKYKPIVFSLFNLGVFVLLSLFSETIWNNVPIPSKGTMFMVTLVSLFIVPLGLGTIRIFIKRMEDVLL